MQCGRRVGELLYCGLWSVGIVIVNNVDIGLGFDWPHQLMSLI